MEQRELERYKRIFANKYNVSEDKVRVIPKSELVEGVTYDGECRNADEAVWLGDRFEYDRYKFGYTFKEKINHFEDDEGYDVFVPMEIIGNKPLTNEYIETLGFRRPEGYNPYKSDISSLLFLKDNMVIRECGEGYYAYLVSEDGKGFGCQRIGTERHLDRWVRENHGIL